LYQTELSHFYKPSENIMKHLYTVPLVYLGNTGQQCKFLPFPVSDTLQPNSSLLPKQYKDFIAVGKTHQFLLKSLQAIQSCEKYGNMYLCQGQQNTRNDLEDTCLGA
jgi:hypothetical protein